MRITALVSLAAAVLAIADASPLKFSPKHGHAVPLTRNPNFKHNTQAQINKMSVRYGNIRAASTGTVPLVNVQHDIEYYGTVSVGTPAQNVKLDFDTGSSDIWFPSSSCTTTACKKHVRFNSAASSTFQKDGRKWNIRYGDNSTASGILGSDIVSVGGVKVRQTIGLATAESASFATSPEDGLFGLGFNTIESVAGVKTFLDNAIAANLLVQPVVSVFLPSYRRNGGVGGEYLFGGINADRYTGSLTYINVSEKGYWQIPMSDITYNGASLGQAAEGIVDTGTTLVIIGTAAAKAVHQEIEGSVFTPATRTKRAYWAVPCSLQSSTDNVGFELGGTIFNIPVADVAYEDLGDGSGLCYSGIQGGQDDLWILGDVFIKNNYCVFDQGATPRIGIAPAKY
ncbi:rhizopuspepsin 2 precursor [Linnemannia elongata]|nr:rhizopuspepsin 2 precursor [Linnemannia elongata]